VMPILSRDPGSPAEELGRVDKVMVCGNAE
jgi:hypothetical protein